MGRLESDDLQTDRKREREKAKVIMFLREFICVWQLTQILAIVNGILKLSLTKRKQKRLALGREEERKPSLSSENGLAEKDKCIMSMSKA